MSRTRLPSAAFLLASLATLSLGCWAQNATSGTTSAAASTSQSSNEGCSAAALRGTYVVQFDGQGTTSPPPQFSTSDFFPISVLGTFTFGGNGTMNRNLTVTAAAVPPFPVSGTGSYQVASDCSGTI